MARCPVPEPMECKPRLVGRRVLSTLARSNSSSAALLRGRCGASPNRPLRTGSSTGSAQPDTRQLFRWGGFHAMERRPLSVEEVAVYLGLGSRFAVYHLISSGQLATVRLGRRIRVDLRDLDAMIENAKTVVPPRSPALGRRVAVRGVPTRLAPLKRRERRRSPPRPAEGAC